MFNSWEEDRLYLERKFTDPEFYKNAPGLPIPEILKLLEVQAAKDRALSHAVSKAKGFELLIKNTQIDVSNRDYFPGLAFALKSPRLLVPSYVLHWGQEARKEVLSEAELNDITECYDVRLAHIRLDYDHCVPDWDAVLELGFSGLLERVLKYRQFHLDSGTMSAEKADFFQSVEIEYRAALSLLDRLIAEAEKLPEQPKGKRILSALQSLRSGKAENFYEALLQIWLYFLLSEYGDIVQTRSFGNLDRVLYKYFRNDLDSGTFSEDDIRYIIRSFMYQSTAMHYTVGHPFYFGGTNADGSSAINELSFLILDEYDKLGIFDPKLHIKVSPQTPVEFVDKALDMIRRGHNSIVFVGEPCIIRTMLKHGYTQREGETADIKGCYEYCARGGTVETAPVTINAVKVIGLTLRNGVELLSGKKLGLETGEADSFKSFGQFYKAFLKQLFHITERFLRYSDAFESTLDQVCPAPLLSGCFESSLRRAVDGYGKGAKYNNSNLWICGSATAGDSLMMIKKYVFDRKEFTLSELVNMLDKDFEGFEVVRQKLLNDHEKYGNNLEQPDKITVHFCEAAARRFNGRPNSRGGFYTTSLHASNRFFQWADFVEASPDGRKRGDELSKNATSTQGNAFSGATALVASILKFDSSLFMANLPIDIMLHPSEVKGAAGLQAMRSLLMTYIKNFGHAMHFNVMDPEILRKAQKDPEKYRHLQVRICGWNVLWNSIGRKEQDAYIRQAERL